MSNNSSKQEPNSNLDFLKKQKLLESASPSEVVLVSPSYNFHTLLAVILLSTLFIITKVFFLIFVATIFLVAFFYHYIQTSNRIIVDHTSQYLIITNRNFIGKLKLTQEIPYKNIKTTRVLKKTYPGSNSGNHSYYNRIILITNKTEINLLDMKGNNYHYDCAAERVAEILISMIQGTQVKNN